MLAILDRQNHILDSANDFAFPAANIIIQTCLAAGRIQTVDALRILKGHAVLSLINEKPAQTFLAVWTGL